MTIELSETFCPSHLLLLFSLLSQIPRQDNEDTPSFCLDGMPSGPPPPPPVDPALVSHQRVTLSSRARLTFSSFLGHMSVYLDNTTTEHLTSSSRLSAYFVSPAPVSHISWRPLYQPVCAAAVSRCCPLVIPVSLHFPPISQIFPEDQSVLINFSTRRTSTPTFVSLSFFSLHLLASFLFCLPSG